MRRGTGERGTYVLLDVTSIFSLQPRASSISASSNCPRSLMCVISDANNAAAARLMLDRIIAKERASSIRKYRNTSMPHWRHANGAALVCERAHSEKCGFIRIKPARQYGEQPTRIRSSLCSLLAKRADRIH